MTIRLNDYRELLDIGLPMFGQHAAGQSVRVLIIGVVTAAGGPAAVSAYTIGASVASIAFIPAGGLKRAAQSVIGQNIGAENPMRASRTTWVGVAIAAVGLTVIGVIQWFIPGVLTNAFVPDVSQATYDLTVDYLRILAYGYWGIGVMYLIGAGFNGASRTKTTMVADMVKYWVIRLPIAAVGVFWLGIRRSRRLLGCHHLQLRRCRRIQRLLLLSSERRNDPARIEEHQQFRGRLTSLGFGTPFARPLSDVSRLSKGERMGARSV